MMYTKLGALVILLLFLALAVAGEPHSLRNFNAAVLVYDVEHISGEELAYFNLLSDKYPGQVEISSTTVRVQGDAAGEANVTTIPDAGIFASTKQVAVQAGRVYRVDFG